MVLACMALDEGERGILYYIGVYSIENHVSKRQISKVLSPLDKIVRTMIYWIYLMPMIS
jgi:hypothetical protein